MTPIDVGEKWAAVLGVKPVLSKRVEKITDGQKAEVASLEETIAKKAKALVNDSLVPPGFAFVDYEKVLDQTMEEIDIPQIEAMIRALPGEDQLAYMTIAKKQYMALQSSIPRSTYQTFAGSENLTPDFSALVEFNDLFNGLEDPISFLFGAVADGSLDRGVANAVKTVFPTLTLAILAAIQDAVADKISKSKSYTLPWKAEIGMQAFLGAPIEPGIPAPQGKPEAPAQRKKPSKDVQDALLTPTQKVDAS